VTAELARGRTLIATYYSPVEADPSAGETWYFAQAPPMGDWSGPPPRVSGRGPGCGRKQDGQPLTIHHDYYIKPMYPPGEHGRGSLLAPGGRAPQG
jgi:hypothetical protein